MYGAYLPKKPKVVLVLGSGPLQIGQAGEFDYSGSQAIKALKEEKIRSVLVNPNIATIQTSRELADKIYLHAITPETIEQVLEKDHVDAIFLSFGGQTALNCGLALERSGVLDRFEVEILGSSVETIRDTEDRNRFTDCLHEIDIKVARSICCITAAEAAAAAKTIGFPLMLRGGFTLGGKGSGICSSPAELDEALRRAFSGGTEQVLVEESLKGWKEIEYEVVRDFRDNCITVCNMENLDPMGIHTGESIVVAPSQTLTNDEYQALRSISIKTVRHLGVIGECNIQFALDPNSNDYRVIEVNARLSRSSALASKATGYPLAYVAAKLALGYTLPEIPNYITRRTTAFFEPALDYIVCKVPRWDLTKFHGATKKLGSEMKSVGEVMSIGRSFPEVIQKALRMLDIGVDGLASDAYSFDDIAEELENGTPRRIFAIAKALRQGQSVQNICQMTQIDSWFIKQIDSIVNTESLLSNANKDLNLTLLKTAKLQGFSDEQIAHLTGIDHQEIRALRKNNDIVPHVAQIDTMAAEYPAETNYLYSSYGASKSDITPARSKSILVLGSGVYRIGSSVEFDWCCVSAVNAVKELGYEALLLNCNPETVSTDFDVCDRLYFDEISFEKVLDICDEESPEGVIVSMGGQIANNLALRLHEEGINVLGTPPESIDTAEDRQKFSHLLDQLGIDQPLWGHVTEIDHTKSIVDKIGGFPVLVRPSYVLSGAAMSVAHEPVELSEIMGRAKRVSPNHPVVISKFELNSREIEIDAVAHDGELVLWAVSEHIEDAGVHSGDATLILPPQTLYLPTIRRIKEIATTLAKELKISGPFNMQFLAKKNMVKVIECNLRASRSFPFVSKVTGNNFSSESVRRMLGSKGDVTNNSLDLDFVAVKVPMFSFARLLGVDPMLGVEMASTGEVGCLGRDLNEALLNGLLATGFQFPKNAVLLSLGPITEKYSFVEEARIIHEKLGLEIYATSGTAEMLQALDIPCTLVGKSPQDTDSALELLDSGRIDLVINIPRTYDEKGRPDGYHIRRRAVEANISLITDLQLGRAIIEALTHYSPESLAIRDWGSYVDHVN